MEGRLLLSVSLATLATILDLLPAACPLFAPIEWAATGLADFGWQVFLLVGHSVSLCSLMYAARSTIACCSSSLILSICL